MHFAKNDFFNFAEMLHPLNHIHQHLPNLQSLSRRDFLKIMEASATGLFLAACGIDETDPTGTPTAFPSRTLTPFQPATTTPTFPTTTPEIPTVTDVPATAKVAIARAVSYEGQYVLQQVQSALDSLGGINDIIHSGDCVAIKVNLTGGTLTPAMRGIPRTESYFTHPAVVLALGKLLRDAGATHLSIVEAIANRDAFSDSGYEEVARELGAQLIDLNSSEPYKDFYQARLGNEGLVYESFTLNPILENIDVFVSVPKLKCHWFCGVTLSMKNSIGLAPVQYYRNNPKHNDRSAFHGRAKTNEYKLRLPQVIMDLNRACPIDLVLIDGVQTVDGGEGPWHDLSVQRSHVLIAGKNAVATDAVGTAVMGFDPVAEHPNSPFLHGWNHLNIAHALGFGSNRLEDIQVLGEMIEDVRCNFRPSL